METETLAIGAKAVQIEAAEDKGMVEVRYVKIGDKVRWLELFQQQVLFHEGRIDYLSSEQYEITWRRLLDSTSPISGLVAIYSGDIVGIAHYFFHPSTWTLNEYCYLQDLFVDASVRGKGIGRKLLQEVYKIAKNYDSPRLYWVTKSSNENARALYDSFVPASDMVQYLLPIPTNTETRVEESSLSSLASTRKTEDHQDFKS